MKNVQATSIQHIPLGVLVWSCETLQEAMVIACAVNTSSVNTRLLPPRVEARDATGDWCVVEV